MIGLYIYLINMLVFLFYSLIRNVMIKIIKYYLILIQIGLILMIIEATIHLNINVGIIYIASQFLLILGVIKIYLPDIKRKKLYQIVAKSQVITFIIAGFTNIPEEMISKYEVELADWFKTHERITKFNCCFVIYDKKTKEIQISMIFSRKDDYTRFIQNKCSDKVDYEEAGKGVLVKYNILPELL